MFRMLKEKLSKKRDKSFFKSHLIGSSEDDTWKTPKMFFEELDKEFNFTLDAAALGSSTLVKNNWYGPDHPDKSRRDALTADWSKDSKGGIVWLNPPYGSGITKQWLAKATQEARDNGVETLVLIPARTGALWFHEYCFPHRIRFIKRRLKFNDGANAAPFDSALVWIKKENNPGYF